MAQDDVSHLYIPISGSDTAVASDEVVAIPLNELPEDVEDILDILRAEEAPLALWLDFAKAYLAQGRTMQYLNILRGVTSKDVEDYFGKEAEYERIQALCAFAAYHMRLGRSEVRDRTKRNDEFQQAASYLNQALKINVEEQLPHIGLGQLALAKGDLEGAREHFKVAIGRTSRGRSNIMGLVCLANVLVKQKKYPDALTLYSKALKDHPEAPPDVRLGLGICFFQLGKFDRARAAFERVLQLDPSNCDALVGLSVLSLNAASPTQDSGDLKLGLDYLCQAYDSDPTHPVVLSLLAQVCLVRGDFEKCIRLATTAFEVTDLDRLKVDTLTYIARANHALGKFQEAYRYYQQARQLDGQAPLPLYGLAQLSLLQQTGDYTNAISFLENALSQVPGWMDALQVLGQLYPQSQRKGDAAIEHFREAAQKPGSPSEVWEMLADLLATTDPSGSLAAYKKAVSLAREAHSKERAKRLKAAIRKYKAEGGTLLQNGHVLSQNGAEQAEPSGLPTEQVRALEEEVDADMPPLPPKLLNNAGVLHLRLGDTSTGTALFQEALKAAEKHGGPGLAPGNMVTLGYNRARAREAGGALKAAAQEYKSILQAFPGYVDCYIRLAFIASRKGASGEALDWANKALSQQPDNPDLLCLLGWLHLDTRAWAKAEACFQKLIKDSGNRNDSYAWLGLATLNLYSAPVDRKKEPEAGKAERALARAGDAYRRVLEKNESNIYAANGMGAVLAENGHLTTAREIFTAVQEAAAASEGLLRIPDVAVNLGNVHLAQQEYVAAIQMYQSTLKKYYGGRDATVLLYLARAYYDSDRLPEACSALLKAVHLQPTNQNLRFNVALTLQEYAVRTLRKKRPEGDPSKLEEFQRAAMELAQAHRFFSQLSSLGEAVTGIPSKRLDTHIAFCADTHARAAQHLDLAMREADALEARRQQSQKALEAAQRQRELELEHKRAAEAKARENAERLAREAAERLEAMRSQWRESSALQQAADEGDAARLDKRRKKKKMEAALAGLDEEDDYMPQDEEAPDVLEDDEARARLAGTGLLSDDEDEGDGETMRGTPEGPGPSLEDQVAAQAPGETPGKSRLKRRRAEGVSDGATGGGEMIDDILQEEGGSPAKKQKRGAALLEDSDEDDTVPVTTKQDAEDVSQPPTGGKPTDDDLFGSDSD